MVAAADDDDDDDDVVVNVDTKAGVAAATVDDAVDGDDIANLKLLGNNLNPLKSIQLV